MVEKLGRGGSNLAEGADKAVGKVLKKPTALPPDQFPWTRGCSSLPKSLSDPAATL